MRSAIIGFGNVGAALVQAFARKGIEVTVAGRRPPEALAPAAAKIGPSIVPARIEDAVAADVVLLAVPFAAYRDVARAAARWDGRVVVDAMNAFGVSLEDLGGLPSTAAVARALPGAAVVKAFNHLPAATLAQDPARPGGGRRVVFVSGDDAAARATVASLADQLGFAPVDLGALDVGGLLVQVRGSAPGRLVLQDLAKFD